MAACSPRRANARGLTALAKMNERFAAERPGDDLFQARIKAYELAARMQEVRGEVVLVLGPWTAPPHAEVSDAELVGVQENEA